MNRVSFQHTTTHPARHSRLAPFFQPANTPVIQASFDDPNRYAQVHQNLFVTAPGGQARQTWQEPASADLIVQQFKTNFPPQPQMRVPVRTTENDAEADAIAMDARIRATFPEITTPVSESRLRDAVQIMDSSFFSDDDFRRQWLANQMMLFTDIENFDIQETDARFRAVQDRLFADPDIGDDIENKMRLQSAFARGDTPADREIFLNRGIAPGQRQLTLIHEIVHFYAHPDYRAWIDACTAPRVYNEGLTEFLARQVMNATELRGRSSYRDQLDAVNTDIVPFVPVSDIRKAFFQGEVWRMEHQSEVARRVFGAQIGLDPSANRATEVQQSGVAQGIAQQVSNTHFRFMNLAVGGDQPKPEHVAFFQQIKQNRLDANPLLKIKFIGHASGTGPASFNLQLSQRRATAFYNMAIAEGLDASRLIDRNPPEHHGESQATTDNDSVIGRAFNRRVEMILST
ncbi:MAG TPA: OmpA family protein [Saprospiraceae bacterium]|nr:OmpA family protein [Saprospiraceae bacterium]HMQ82155.1 OmpA family protein [Saprospiraceae bacterium]